MANGEWINEANFIILSTNFLENTKATGAQTDERLAQYKKRYKDWEDPNGK